MIWQSFSLESGVTYVVSVHSYRYYGEESLLRLQQIRFYRELDMPLDEIKQIMGRRDFDVLGALQSHRQALREQVARLNRLIQTVDNTIDHLKGNQTMSDKAYFEGFSEEQQEKYALEAEGLYDPETVRESNRKWKAYPAARKGTILAEGRIIYTDMIAAMPKGPESSEAQAIVERWRRHIEYFWTPNEEQLPGLAQSYVDDPRFRANFDKMHSELAVFMCKAVKVYVANRKK